MKEKYLVIGSSGLLGSFLFALLKKNKYEVTGVDSDELDITKKEDLIKYFSDKKFTTVINCAALTNVEGIEDELFDQAMKVNGISLGYLSKILSDNGINLVHISSDYVNDSNEKEGYYEDAVIAKAMNRYGDTKLRGEKEILKNWGKGSNARYFIVRTQWLFGPSASNFISKITKFSKELERLKVVDDEFGCPTYIKDLSLGVIELIEDGHPSGIYHISSSNSTSIYEFAKKILELQGINTPIDRIKLGDFDRKAKINNYSILKNSKLPPRRSWEDMLEDFFSVYKL